MTAFRRFPVVLFIIATVKFQGSNAFFSIFSAPSTATQQSTLLKVEPRLPIGRVKSLDRRKVDSRPDSIFHEQPKFVTHTDQQFIDRLRKVYEQQLPDNATILDICSSHVSHLPTTLHYKRVDIHGMNVDELKSNPWRSITKGKAFIRDFNENPTLVGLCDQRQEYDAVLCALGIQYIQEPEALFADVARILKPNGKCIITFSNRFFYEGALAGWIERGMLERTGLIKSYFQAAGGYDLDSIQVVGDGTSVWKQLMSVGGIGSDPFVSVIATKKAADISTRI